jgi:hypothetical protein
MINWNNAQDEAAFRTRNKAELMEVYATLKAEEK